MLFSHVCVDMGSCVAAIGASAFFGCMTSVVHLFYLEGKDMKRNLALLLALSIMMIFTACGKDEASNQTHNTENISIGETNEQENTETKPKHQYVGDYEQEPVYQKLLEIENCKDPETLVQLLTEIYGEEFTYIKMEHKSTNNPNENEHSGYEAPYDDFMCAAFAVYNASSPLCKSPFSSDTYLFFKPYSEEPSFVMDSNATYIVYSYKIKNFDDGTHYHSVNSWIISDLFLCLHEYIDADLERKEFSRDAVRYMDYYLELENLVIDNLGGNAGSISKTESLRPSIDVLSVEITGPTMHELNVNYRINNISEERGVAYLTCSAHAYQDELHFNDENFKNDYREDGCFEYDVYYGGSERPVTFAIFYGYGEFDPYEGWDSECMTTITLLYTEDYGEISSSTIPADEIYPLYFEGEYVGAWTVHESRDLIEVNGNSSATPFERHNTFKSEKGFVVSVEVTDGTPFFTINGAYVGAPTDTYEYDGVVFYTLWYNNESLFINRYPNDEYIRLQSAWSLVGDGDINLYPQ